MDSFSETFVKKRCLVYIDRVLSHWIVLAIGCSLIGSGLSGLFQLLFPKVFCSDQNVLVDATTCNYKEFPETFMLGVGMGSFLENPKEEPYVHDYHIGIFVSLLCIGTLPFLINLIWNAERKEIENQSNKEISEGAGNLKELMNNCQGKLFLKFSAHVVFKLFTCIWLIVSICHILKPGIFETSQELKVLECGINGDRTNCGPYLKPLGIIFEIIGPILIVLLCLMLLSMVYRGSILFWPQMFAILLDRKFGIDICCSRLMELKFQERFFLHQTLQIMSSSEVEIIKMLLDKLEIKGEPLMSSTA